MIKGERNEEGLLSEIVHNELSKIYSSDFFTRCMISNKMTNQ